MPRDPLADRIYRRLLVAFPREVRDADGDEMTRQFAERLRETGPVGAKARLWALAAWDVLRHGFGCRWHQRSVTLAGPGERVSWRWDMRRLLMDLRYGWRAYRRTPGVTLIAVTAIALGIGANTALFSFANGVFLRPLPVADPDRLVSLLHVGSRPGSYSSFSYPDYLELRDQNDALGGLAAWSTITLDLGRPSTERIPSQIVSGNYFQVLGVTPAAGRLFVADDDRGPEPPAIVVISETFWRREFGGDPAAVGRPLALNGRDFTIVGVAPAAFAGLTLDVKPVAWVPLATHRMTMPSFRAFGTELFGNRGTHWLELTGRLAPGVSMARATASFDAIAVRQAAANPETNKGWSIAAVSTQQSRLGPPDSNDVARLTGLLLVVVGLVLVIVSANVANLLLARAAMRKPEIGVRLATGATRRHVVIQMIVESLLLAGVGGAIGVGLAALAVAWLPSIDVTGSLPGLDPHLDYRVLGFALALTAITGMAFGLAPALQAASTNVGDMLKLGGRSAAGGQHGRLRHLMVAVQVALCMVLLIGAGLTLRTIVNLRGLPLGFELSDQWMMTVDLSQRESSAEATAQTQLRILEQVRALPGVEGAAFGFMTPFVGLRMANDVFWVPPGGDPQQRQRTNVDMNIVGPEYFEVMGIAVLRGRPFRASDAEGGSDVAIVNRSMSDRLWPDADPIGRTVWSWNPGDAGRPLQVVGVVEDGRYYLGWRSGARPFLFVPAAQWPQGNLTVHARGAGLTAAMLRDAARSVAPDIPAPTPVRMADAMAESMALERTGARVLAAFAMLALVIACIGIYSVVAFSVGERAHEIGIRMALGAPQLTVVASVIVGALKPLLAGVVVGWLGALGLTRFMNALLYGITPTDPMTYLVVAALLVTAGAGASYFPARRAAGADPLRTLRAD